MNSQEIDKILADAVEIYGAEAQTWMAIEEMSELSNALAKHRRDRVTKENVCEEIADVAIMMMQLTHIYGADEVNNYFNQKIDRLDERLAKHRDNQENV